MMLKLMQRSKLALAFHMMVEPQGMRPKARDFVTSRWFEQLAAGCVVLGKRPGLAEGLFGWTDATIELPDDPADAAGTIAALRTDEAFLASTRRRNVLEMCRRHDWRYRIRDVLRHFEMPLPARLESELLDLDTRVHALATSTDSASTSAATRRGADLPL
jgi:hypothetical protein